MKFKPCFNTEDPPGFGFTLFCRQVVPMLLQIQVALTIFGFKANPKIYPDSLVGVFFCSYVRFSFLNAFLMFFSISCRNQHL